MFICYAYVGFTVDIHIVQYATDLGISSSRAAVVQAVIVEQPV